MHVHSYEHGVDVVAAVFLIIFTIIIQVVLFLVLHYTKDNFESIFPRSNEQQGDCLIPSRNGMALNPQKPSCTLTVFEGRARDYSRVPGTFDTSAFH
jgi:hypothetical protein